MDIYTLHHNSMEIAKMTTEYNSLKGTQIKTRTGYKKQLYKHKG